MTSPIQLALEALDVAKDSGGENDLDMYKQAHTSLRKAVDGARAYARQLHDRGVTPSAGEFAHLLSILGIDSTVAGNPVSQQAVITADDIQRLAKVLRASESTSVNAVHVFVDVADPALGDYMSDATELTDATINLVTGKLSLTYPKLGKALFKLKETKNTPNPFDPVIERQFAVITIAGKSLYVPILEDSLPADIDATDVADHIAEHGYWAKLDLVYLLRKIDEIAS